MGGIRNLALVDLVGPHDFQAQEFARLRSVLKGKPTDQSGVGHRPGQSAEGLHGQMKSRIGIDTEDAFGNQVELHCPHGTLAGACEDYQWWLCWYLARG